MNKYTRKVKLISRNVLESVAYYSRFNQLYHFPFNAKVYNTVCPVTFAVIRDCNDHLSIFMTKPS